MKFDIRHPIFHFVLALFAGLAFGLVYSWKLSPVTYVDANPSILRADFKDQYRLVIAASYASTRDITRARARLDLLGDADPVAELSAQAQRMLAAGETFERVRPIAQLATDLQQGFVSIPLTNTPLPQVANTSMAETPLIEEVFPSETPFPSEPTLSFDGTQLAPPPDFTATPRPTFTSIPGPQAPFTLVGQDTVCDPTLKDGLLQILLMDARRRQVAGIKIIVTWANGESRFFTGLKPELGNGYADFLMKEDTVYSVRLEEGGAFVPNIAVPTCTDQNGAAYPGGLFLTFQQP
jgi:hypothetical protein